MTQNCQLIELQSRHNREQLRHVIPNMIGRIQRAVIAQTLARQVGGNESVFAQKGRNNRERQRIIKPTVQRQDRITIGVTPLKSRIGETIGRY